MQGFTAELGASGCFCPAHVMLPVKAYFFSLSDDNAPSPYLVSLASTCTVYNCVNFMYTVTVSHSRTILSHLTDKHMINYIKILILNY